MEQFGNVGKMLAIIGVLIFITGVAIMTFGKIPFIGKLPGDFAYKGKNFSFYFPLATSILVSIILSLILYFVRRFF